MSQADETTRSQKTKAILLLSLLVSFIIATTIPVIFLIRGKGQMTIANAGVRFLPLNSPKSNNWSRIRVVYDCVGDTFGGESTIDGTYIVTPPGLVHTQMQQWGSVQWWDSHIIKAPGTATQADIDAATKTYLHR